MVGSATFTIVKSTIVMKYAATSSANAVQRRPSAGGRAGREAPAAGCVPVRGTPPRSVSSLFMLPPLDLQPKVAGFRTEMQPRLHMS